MKTKFLLLCASVAMVLTSCGSSKSVATTGQDVEIIIPCAGLEYSTSAEYFRANAMGISNSMEVANQKAMQAARSELAAAIETKVKTVTDNYISSYENNQSEEMRGRFQALSREVVSQKLSGIRVICQKTMQASDGKYKCYVAIELAGTELIKSVADKISDDEKLRTDFEYQKFLETFNAEMSNL